MANDHYVPQFYLCPFQAVQGKVWVYQRGAEPRLRGIKKVASKEGYYTLKTSASGLPNDQPDKVLQALESEAAPIIKFLQTASSASLPASERQALSMFISALHVRTPHHRERMTNLHSAVHKELLKFFAGDKSTFGRYAEKHAITDPGQVELTRQMAFDESLYLDYEPDSSADYFLGQALQMLLEIEPYIRQKHWHLLEPTHGRVFVTSDNPVVIVPPPNYSRYMGLGIGSADIALPLSPTRCLLLTNYKLPDDFITLSPGQTERVITWTVWRAHTNVFSSEKSDSIKATIDRTVPGQNTKVEVSGGLTKEDVGFS